MAELVDRCCTLARRFATQLGAVDGISVVNDVVLNQVLVRFGHDDATTERVIEAVQRSGQCWMGSTTRHGQRLMRISVSSWRTTEADVDRPVRAIVAAAHLIQARAAETGPALPGTPSDRYPAGKARGGDPAGHRDKEVALA